MLTLTLLIVTQLFFFSLMAWAMAFVARRMGSTRGQLRWGILCVLLFIAVNLLIFALGKSIPVSGLVATLIAALLFLALQLGAVFFIVYRAFRLSMARTFAPFGACLAVVFSQLIFVLAVLRPYLCEAYVIPTGSMSPTLDVGDRFLVNKIITPRRWDIVAFWVDDPRSDQRQIFCKRLIALPGERLRFEHGNIFINDEIPHAPRVLAGKCQAQPGGIYQDGETIVLGPDDYFFLGDRVEASLDSRTLGPSHRASIIGVVDSIYWPPAKMHVLR